VFGVEATTINTVEVNIDKGIGYHLVYLIMPLKKVVIELQLLSKNNGYSMPGKR
jgi:magnesium chelatase family protein